MSIALGANSRGAGAGGGTQGTTNTITTAATGSAFICMLSNTSASDLACWSDNFGNTYTTVADQVNGPQGLRVQMFVCANGAGGAGHQWTQPFGDRFVVQSFYAVEVTGAALSSILDAVASNLDDTIPYNFPLTTTFANAFIMSFGRSTNNGVTPTANGGFTLLDSNVNSNTTYVMYRIVSATGSYDPVPTFSVNSSTAWITASFKAASGSGGPLIMLLGVG